MFKKFNLNRIFWEYLKLILDLILPQKCFSCAKFSPQEICPNCLIELKPGLHQIQNLENLNACYSLFEYQDKIKDLLALLKFERLTSLAGILGQFLPKITELPFQNIDYWVSVPLHPSRYQKRGFNQVDLLYKPWVNSFHGQFLEAVARIKDTPPLFELSRAERKEVLKNAFSLKPNNISFEGKNLVILDDILTTGTTLGLIAELFLKAGAKSVSGFTLTYVK